MKFCKEHWQQLREAIKERGLDGFIAKSGKEAADRLVLEQACKSLDSFEPLIGAYGAIAGNLLHSVGPTILTGEHCPICTLNEAARKHQAGCTKPDCKVTAEYEKWIGLAADEQLGEFNRRSSATPKN